VKSARNTRVSTCLACRCWSWSWWW